MGKAAAAKAKAKLMAKKLSAKAKAKLIAKKLSAKAKAKASPIAKGQKARVLVYLGKKEKTFSKKGKGLRKEDLVKSKALKIVSRKKSEQGKASKWSKATAKARELKGYKGFKAIKRGTSFYEKAKELLAE